VNADDFGLDLEINRGIDEACLGGMVRSVSLLATGKAFEDAVGRLRRMPRVGVGIHLCLVAERSVLPAQKIQSLVDEQGRFPSAYRNFLVRLWTRRIRPEDIAIELDAQFRKFLDHGIHPTHVDSHQYIHLVPAVSTTVIELSKKYGVKWIRYPSRPERFFPRSLRAAAKMMGLALFSRSQTRRIRGFGIRVPDNSLGFLESGRLDAGKMRVLLDRMICGVNDLTVHPGYCPQEREYAAWNYHWETELAVLKDESTMRLAREMRIRIGNYAEQS